ncbi:MAG TPA: MATE family efflux transporter [Tissierellia bacterium]|nr:MATE family efflux transporter [Tissierellia bacterium]
MTGDERTRALGSEDITSLLFRLTLPAFFGMFVNALYNLVDTLFVGNVVGHVAIGSLSIVNPIQLIIVATSLMVAVGTASSISRNLGAGKMERARAYFRTSYGLNLILGFAIIVLGLIFSEPIIDLFGATAEMREMALSYIRIVLFAAPAQMIVMNTHHILRGEGKSLQSMIGLMIGAFTNIFLDAVFIVYFRWGVEGAAIATVASQYISMLYMGWIYYTGRSSIGEYPHRLNLNIELVKDIFSIGLPTFLRNGTASIIAVFVNISLAMYGGDMAISAYGTVNRLIFFVTLPAISLVQGMQPIAGYNYGAGNLRRLIEVVKSALTWDTLLLTFSTALLFLFNSSIISLFSREPAFIEKTREASWVLFSMVPLLGLQFISSSFFQSLGEPRPALIITLIHRVLVFPPLLWLLPKTGLGLLGVYLAFPISDVISSLIGGLLLKKKISELREEIALSEN